MKNSLIIDCFAGGGGASVGIEMALRREVDIAINHDPEAIRIPFWGVFMKIEEVPGGGD